MNKNLLLGFVLEWDKRKERVFSQVVRVNCTQMPPTPLWNAPAFKHIDDLKTISAAFGKRCIIGEYTIIQCNNRDFTRPKLIL